MIRTNSVSSGAAGPNDSALRTLCRALFIAGLLAALLAMLNSCAGGVTVVNIDNGFGAGYAASMINKKSAVFIFDEIDKAEEYDFLYFILEDIYKKSICLITNFKEWIVTVDSRIKSRLMGEMLEFKQYNEHETHEILKMRAGYAFPEGVWDEAAFNRLAKKTYEL